MEPLTHYQKYRETIKASTKRAYRLKHPEFAVREKQKIQEIIDRYLEEQKSKN